MTTKTQAGDFTTGSIPVKLIKFMLPVLGALVLQAMYGAVDLLVVGRFGSSAGISGVATGGSLVNLFTFVVTALTMGVTVLIGRYIGEGRQDRIGPVIGGAICFLPRRPSPFRLSWSFSRRCSRTGSAPRGRPGT